MTHGKTNILNATINLWSYNKNRDKDLASCLTFSFFTYEHCLLFWRDVMQEKGL